MRTRMGFGESYPRKGIIYCFLKSFLLKPGSFVFKWIDGNIESGWRVDMVGAHNMDTFWTPSKTLYTVIYYRIYHFVFFTVSKKCPYYVRPN